MTPDLLASAEIEQALCLIFLDQGLGQCGAACQQYDVCVVTETSQRVPDPSDQGILLIMTLA